MASGKFGVREDRRRALYEAARVRGVVERLQCGVSDAGGSAKCKGGRDEHAADLGPTRALRSVSRFESFPV